MKIFVRLLVLIAITAFWLGLFRLLIPSKHIIVDIICAPWWASWTFWNKKFKKWFTAPFRVKNGTMRDYVPLKQYFLGRYVFPTIGLILGVCSLGLLINSFYYFFFENNSLYLMKKLRKELSTLEPFGEYFVLFNWFDGLHICLWNDSATFSVHKPDYGCILSSFAPTLRDLERIQSLYLLLKIKVDEYKAGKQKMPILATVN